MNMCVCIIIWKSSRADKYYVRKNIKLAHLGTSHQSAPVKMTDSISKHNLCKECDDMQYIPELLVSDASWITL